MYPQLYTSPLRLFTFVFAAASLLQSSLYASTTSFAEPSANLGKLFLADTTKKKTLEVKLFTKGEVILEGTARNTVSFQAPLGGSSKKDSLIFLKESEQSTLLYSKKKGNSQQGDSHQKLVVGLPKKHDINFESTVGKVHILNIEGSVEGTLQEGPLLLESMQSYALIYAQKGDITIRKGSVSGRVTTGEGNILLEDIDPHLEPIEAFTRNGKLTRRYSSDYFKGKSLELLRLERMEGDVEVASAPKGVSIFTENGNIEVGSAKDSLLAFTRKGNITLPKAEGMVQAVSDHGNIFLTYSGALTKKGESIEVITLQGDVTLTLPATLAASLVIDQQLTDERKDSYTIESEFDLGKITRIPVLEPESNKIYMYQTHVEKAFGKGTCQVLLRVVNGNILIKKSK